MDNYYCYYYVKLKSASVLITCMVSVVNAKVWTVIVGERHTWAYGDNGSCVFSSGLGFRRSPWWAHYNRGCCVNSPIFFSSFFFGLLWIVAVFTPPLSFTPFNLFNQVSHHAIPKKKWTHWMFVFDMPSELCLMHWDSVVCHYLEVLRNVPGPVQVKINQRKLYHHRK